MDNVLKLLRLSYLRIEINSRDPIVASRALLNLEKIGFHKDVLDAIAGRIAAAHD